MNVKISKKFRFKTMLVDPLWDSPVIGSYTCVVTMITASMSAYDHNMAYARIKYWITEVLQDSILISHDNPKLNSWQSTDARCLVLPEDPADQLVGIMLSSKLDAITEGRLVIQEITVHSDIDDDVIYYHSCDDDLGPFTQPGWWQDPGPGHTTSTVRKRSNNKVISLNRKKEWKDLGLNWEDDDLEDSENNVVKAEFNKNDDN